MANLRKAVCHGKKSPSLFQTLFGKGQLRRPSANSGYHPKAQMKIARTLNLVDSRDISRNSQTL